MGFVQSRFGGLLVPASSSRSYWAVKLKDKPEDQAWLSELDRKNDLWQGRVRPFDWALDLLDTSDIMKVTQVWLFVPPDPQHLEGQTRHLEITEPGTAFQFKISNLNTGMGSNMAAQIIGRVDDKETGACTSIIWDAEMGEMIDDYKSSIYDWGTWREGIAHIYWLSHHVLGLRLGYLSSSSPHNPPGVG